MADKLIPAKEAVILWNRVRGTLNASDDVVVVRFPENNETAEVYDCSVGAVSVGWCHAGDPLDWPEGWFAQVVFNAPDPMPRATVAAWLQQFGKIEECGWARQMLAAMVIQDRRNQGGPAA